MKVDWTWTYTVILYFADYIKESIKECTTEWHFEEANLSTTTNSVQSVRAKCLKHSRVHAFAPSQMASQIDCCASTRDPMRYENTTPSHLAAYPLVQYAQKAKWVCCGAQYLFINGGGATILFRFSSKCHCSNIVLFLGTYMQCYF